jgi:ribosomal protein L9
MYPVATPHSSTSSRSGTVLFSAKKKTPAGGAAATKKIQVKLLKHIAGTGQAGDVIQVTPAFFNNKLRPTKSAVMISDDDVIREKAEAQAHEAETTAKATELQLKIEDISMTLVRKAGPTGQLFGGISPKCIMEELQKKWPGDDYLADKHVKIAEFVDGEGKEIKGDIKHTGEFGARIVLKQGIAAKFAIVVQPEA